MSSPYVESSFTESDTQFENPLRPAFLDDFQGQVNIKERLQVMVLAAKERGDPLCHCIFSGPPGLGKTTLAHILANSMGSQIVVTSGPILEKPGDLAGILTSLKKGDVLFIDEIHRLGKHIEEYLYTAMEDFLIDLVIDSGPGARSIQLKLNPFTLAGATTRTGLLSAPLRSRFPFSARLDYYHPSTLKSILHRTGQLLKISLEDEAAMAIAKRSRGTPRIANNLLRWVRDYAQVKRAPVVSESMALEALSSLNIDDHGLDEMDKKILSLIAENYQGGPVGLSTIAAAVGEDQGTIEDVYEPYLIMEGFLEKTARGRKVTQKALIHLKNTFNRE